MFVRSVCEHLVEILAVYTPSRMADNWTADHRHFVFRARPRHLSAFFCASPSQVKVKEVDVYKSAEPLKITTKASTNLLSARKGLWNSVAIFTDVLSPIYGCVRSQHGYEPASKFGLKADVLAKGLGSHSLFLFSIF